MKAIVIGVFPNRHKSSKLALGSVLYLLITLSVIRTAAWSNGGYSDDPSVPDYGTHDWMAQHALDWLPAEERKYIADNLAAYLYGTEMPDNPDGIGDTMEHHIYYSSTGSLIDDSAALRAQEEYDRALSYLEANDLAMAAETLGTMAHYISDVAAFGHVMGSATDWGAEVHHSDYESYVNSRTNSYVDDFNSYLSFDGSLRETSAYDAAKGLAYDTTFDVDGDLTCKWMDENYDWGDKTFSDRCGESLNLAVNYLSDVLHTIYVRSPPLVETGDSPQVVMNEVELNPPEDDRLSTTMEWVELYNPTSVAVDIGGWTVSTTHGETVTVTISSGRSLQPNGYLIVERANWLDNDDELLILRGSHGEEVDRTPTISDGENDGRSWSRFPNGRDSDSFLDWRFQSSTKGYSNGGEAQPKGSSSISCSASPSVSTLGEGMTVSGSISPSHAASITISFVYPSGSTITRTTTSSSDGSYSLLFIPDSEGSWRVKASWSGDSDHEGAESPWASFTVVRPSKKASSITCSASPSAAKFRGRVVVSGSISPAHGGALITLSFMTPNGSTITLTKASESDGSYTLPLLPDSIGTWSVKASWGGDDDHDGTESALATFAVEKASSSITISFTSEISLGQDVIISGSISPVREGAPVKISWRAQGGAWEEIVNTLTDSAGSFYYDWIDTPNVAGAYDVRASWEGDSEHEGSEKVSSLKVSKLHSSISVGLSESTITFGESIELSASMEPPLGNASLVIIYTRPNGSILTRTVITSETGSYVDPLKPDIAGTWSAKASWSGNSNYEGTESNVLSFVVNKTPTLIEITLSGESLELGQSLTVSGEISPSPGRVDIELRYTRPDGTTFTRSAMTSEDGYFEDTYEPDKEGDWTVEVSWPGSENYEASTGSPISFSANQPFPTVYVALGIILAVGIILILRVKRKR